MKSLRRLLPLLLLPLLITACSTTKSTSSYNLNMPTPQAGASFQPKPGKAGIYIYKKGSVVGIVDNYQITVDGQLLGTVASNAYLYTSVLPGHHTISTDYNKVVINAKVGKNYFIKQTTSVDSSGEVLGSTVKVVPASVGQPDVKAIQIENSGT